MCLLTAKGAAATCACADTQQQLHAAFTCSVSILDVCFDAYLPRRMWSSLRRAPCLAPSCAPGLGSLTHPNLDHICPFRDDVCPFCPSPFLGLPRCLRVPCLFAIVGGAQSCCLHPLASNPSYLPSCLHQLASNPSFDFSPVHGSTGVDPASCTKHLDRLLLAPHPALPATRIRHVHAASVLRASVTRSCLSPPSSCFEACDESCAETT